ncbi:hypothetical protein JQ760_028450 (plasmid) [Klebsiella pneumoniae]|uniref:hypothetical protein n=1 Tax=Klebsiella pneumoniae TaxID=573 RepID=UPI001FAD8AFE|nr:hypothetical protein [Klebsiella pneumoniae]MCI8108405.1 hypothetical protein [Klebsiella pneumoniae]
MFSVEDILIIITSLTFLWFVLSRLNRSGRVLVLALIAIFSVLSAYIGSSIDWTSLTRKNDVELRVEKILNHHRLPLAVVKDSGWLALVDDFKRTVQDAVVAGREYPDKAVTAVLGRMREYNAEAARKLNVPDLDVILRNRIEQRDKRYEACLNENIDAIPCLTAIHSIEG